MRIVVTGATGLTGGRVVRELVRGGHEVVGTTRRAEAVAAVSALGGRGVVADPHDPASLGAALRGADALVHVAGILHGASVALSGIEALSRVVVVSTASVHSPSHRSAEAYLRNEAAIAAVRPDAVFARPTMIYGSPRDRNVHKVIAFVRRFRVLPLPDRGDALIQPIHYADLAAAVAALTASDVTGPVDAGGPHPLSLRRAAEVIFAALGLPALLLPAPFGLAMPLARGIDGVARSRWAERLERAREQRVVDNLRLLQATGVALRSFEDGVAAEVAEMGGTGP